MGDIQSNLANFLKDLNVQNAAAFQGLGDTIGAIADAAGAIAGIGGIVSLVGSLIGQGDQTQAELQKIIASIQAGFQQLQAEQRATNIIHKLTDLGNQLAAPKAVLDDLQNLLNLQPPLSDADRLGKIETCIAGINALAPDGNWEQAFADPIYWTDAGVYLYPTDFIGHPNLSADRGYGEQAPSGDPGGLVFSYVYILPAYLDALFIFLAVAGALDPNFARNYADTVIRPAIALLQAKHDKIVTEGITQLLPPQWDGATLSSWLLAMSEQNIPGITPADLQKPFDAGVNIEYGAVEKFSGYSSVGNYQITLQANDTDPRPYNKFRLRVLRRAKLVYQAIGLATNALKLLVDGGAEGVVFKDRNATYSAGRPHTGGPALKWKFIASASVVVARHHREGKRSVEMALRDGTVVGHVTIPAKHGRLPLIGTVIEVGYLYAFRGGSLVQSVYKGIRSDVDADTAGQLQYKGEARK